jgi:stage II sporulation protein R
MEKRKLLMLWEKALLLSLSLTLCAGVWAQGRQQSISSSLVRLHVLAHSDSAYEQGLKLRVRDAILSKVAAVTENCADRRAAAALLIAHAEELGGIAATAAGMPVSISLAPECYETRRYEGFALPAGEYLSLRIMIGEGSGQNWWCVVFPPLCTAAATDFSMTALAAGFSEDEVALLAEEPGYVLRFKTVELWETLKRYWEK